MGYRKILLATDGSDPSLAAENVAGDLASCVAACHDGCELIVATVIPPAEGSIADIPYRGAAPRDPLITLPTKEMEDEAAELVAEAGARIKAAYPEPSLSVRAVILRDASPARGILNFIETEEGCGYIVIGNRGHGGVSRLILGSVSTEVLHGASCPVVIVRE